MLIFFRASRISPWPGPRKCGLHERAAAATRKQFGKKVFVRAVVEVSNFCRENCGYCGMRRDNITLPRFRAHAEQLAELLIHHRPASVTDINIQAGEDPVAVREVVLPLIRTLRRETALGHQCLPGHLDAGPLSRIAGGGCEHLHHEIRSRRIPRDTGNFPRPARLDERLQHIRLLAETGWHVSSGFIAGLPGQTLADLRRNFALARSLPLHGCSVSPFIPGEETPLAAAPAAERGLDPEFNRRPAAHAARLGHSRRQRSESRWSRTVTVTACAPAPISLP